MAKPDRNSDDAIVRRATRGITLWIALAAAVLVIGVLALVILVIVQQSQPSELLEPPRPGSENFYVDSYKVVVALLVIGAGAILFAAVAGRLAAKRAVRPQSPSG